ncbi:MAG: AmmeMemoRadiSam system protein B [Candidatus Doudnabacteria bacterium]|nr:AmmeMemoRadiSam system protein B [Candidatus Doudnabacteria bacterium]
MKTLFKSILTVLLLMFLFFWYVVKPKLDTELPSRGLHYGINQNAEFFEQAYANISAQKPSDPIAGITVNHHLLAPHLIAREFALVATDKPITVLLVSPNHFYRGNGGAITSQYDWQTPYGVLKADQTLATKLSETGLVNIDETPFEQEHGISSIVGFIKKSLPNAKIVPVIVKDNLPDSQVDELALKLQETLPKDVLIVGSLDFSHYLPSNAAKFHDIQTLAVINNFDYKLIPKLDIDSHPGLQLLLKYFDATGHKKFVVTAHENSSTVTGNYSFVETTSYINGYFTQGQNQTDSHRTILYVQGLKPEDHWKPDASERLYKFTEIVTTKPKELDRISLGSQPMAVGLVYNPDLTDIYLFPLDITNHIITLRVQPNPDTMHIQIK